MPLEEYRRKRDSRRTPEPVPEHDPAADRAEGRAFVIQEHHARRLHWDVRLERDGVLASWAVPKGLPTEPGTIRLAVRTEDHPVEYLEFSGEIPAGEYGGGRMTIWDRGRYDTLKWSDREVAVVLHGQRAVGRYTFVRTGRGGDAGADKDGWIVRRSDPPAREGWDALPHDALPMLATPGELPGDDGYRFQVGFGGLRVIVRVDGGRARFTDPDGVDRTADLGLLRGIGPALGSTQVILDGEVATAPGSRTPGLWIGDVLHLDGRDLRAEPFTDRWAALAELAPAGPHWRLSPAYPAGGADVLAAAGEQGLPYVVAKRVDAPYRAGPSADWVLVATGAAAPPAPPPPRPHRGEKSRLVEAGGRTLRLANPDKVLYPLSGTTKSDVLAHYLAVADVMLPHLAGRPVTMVRWPDGTDAPSFFEKDVSRHAPSWLRTVRIDTPGSARWGRDPQRSARGSGRSAEYADFPLVDDAAGLAWAANLAALELHVPQWRVGPRGGKQAPDLLVFDLDPGEGVTVVDCARVAEAIAELLAEDDLVGYPRTSGGKGLQLYLPVSVSRPERTGEYARAVAERLAEQWPRKVTAAMAKARRVGRVFVDWSQNNPAKTTIASYSLRGRGRPTVATPLTWDEVRAARRPDDLVFVAADLPGRLATHGDLLAPLLAGGQRLPRLAAREE